MPDDELFTDIVHHISEVEGVYLLFHPGMEHHLQQHIPQLLPKEDRILLVDSLYSLVGFLNKVAPDALMGLFPVPRAAIFAAEDLHNL